MGTKTVVKEERINAARGNVPTCDVDETVTVNMGDYNSLHVGIKVCGIDISSPAATKRELETGQVCVRMVYKFTDELTGAVLNGAVGEERAGEFGDTFLRAISDAQRENALKKGK